MRLSRQILGALLLVAIFASGCTVHDAIEPLRPTAFITHPERLTEPKLTPFKLAWMKDGITSWQFQHLIVKPVRTDAIPGDDWIYSASALLRSEENYRERIDELAKYIQERAESEFSEKEKTKNGPEVIYVEQVAPETRTLTVEISLSEVNFGDPVVYAGLLAVPVPAIANLSTAVKSPSIILETRLFDETSGEIVGEMIDRRFPQLKIIDVNRLTVMSAVHEMSDAFVDALVESFYRTPGESVDRGYPISLLPW